MKPDRSCANKSGQIHLLTTSGQPPAFVDDGLQIPAIRVCGQYAAGAEVQEEELAGREYVFRLCVYGVEAIALM
jgi:hypothetical protein